MVFRLQHSDHGHLPSEVTMTTYRDVRLDVLLSAICAIAATLPPEAKRAAGLKLGEQMADLRPGDEAADAAIASDLARILGTLGCLPPSVSWPEAA